MSDAETFHTFSTISIQDAKLNEPNSFVDGDWVESQWIVNSGIRLIQTGNIGVGVYLDKGDRARYIAPSSFGKLRCKWVRPGDILICRLADPIGRACIVPNEVGNCITSVDCTIYRPDPRKLHSKYALHLLNSDDHLKKLNDSAGGSTRQRISRSALGASLISIPDVSVQSIIATILDTIDDAIRHTEQMIEKLQQVKAGLLHDLLTFGLDENGELRDPIRRPEQFKDSPLGRIPTEWEVESVNNLCFEIIDCKNRTPPITKDGHPVIRTPNVRDGLFVLDNLVCTDPKSYTEWTARGKPESGDVVITREAPYGEACIIPDDIVPPCLGQRMMMYKTDPSKLNNEFLVQMIYSQRMQRLFLGLAGGSTVGHLRVGDVRTLPIPHPKDVDEQKAIANYMMGMNAQIASEGENLSKLTMCKQGLMRDLLTGKVPIPQGIVEL